MIDRRDFLVASLALAASATTGPASAAPLDGATRNWLRLTADLSGATTWGVTRGDVWGFLPQADDLTTDTFARRLYGYWSLIARKAAVGAGGRVALRLKGWTFYLDPQSGEIVTQLFNPYTKQQVQCPPLSGNAAMLHYGDATQPPLDLRERRLGEQVWVELDRISRFKPADTTWFKLEADMTSYACRAADLDDPSLPHITNTWSHNLIAEWQTWMKMHGTPGHILFKGDGGFIPSPERIPAALHSAIDTHFAGTLADVAAWGAP